MAQPLIAAVDAGYSYLKAKSRDRDLTQPACVDVAKVMSNPETRNGRSSPDLIIYDAPDSPTPWMVGDMAARQSTTPRYSSNPDRAHDPVFQRGLKACLMYLAEGLTEAEVILITGLPPEQQADEATRKAFAESLRGTYAIKGQINDRQIQQVLNVSEVRCLPQYFGTFFDQVYDIDGNTLRDKLDTPLVKGRKCFIDIGGGTTDIGGMDGLDPIYPMTLSIPKAMNWVYSELRKQHLNLSIATIEREVRAGRIDAAKPMGELTGLIVDELNGVLHRTGFVPEVYIITGGAAELLKPYLDLGGAEVRVCRQSANVDGYLKFGLRRYAARS